MNIREIRHLIDRSLFADLGCLSEDGFPSIRRVFCVWHRGIGAHLISTNTSSGHVRQLMADGRACLYFADSATFEGVCLTGFARVRTDRPFKELLWNDGDEKHYPSGIDDPDYCVIEFIAERAEYYRYDGKGTLSEADIAAFDANLSYENGYDKEHSH